MYKNVKLVLRTLEKIASNAWVNIKILCGIATITFAASMGVLFAYHIAQASGWVK